MSHRNTGRRPRGIVITDETDVSRDINMQRVDHATQMTLSHTSRYHPLRRIQHRLVVTDETGVSTDRHMNRVDNATQRELSQTSFYSPTGTNTRARSGSYESAFYDERNIIGHTGDMRNNPTVYYREHLNRSKELRYGHITTSYPPLATLVYTHK